jgi:hypothetical protein
MAGHSKWSEIKRQKGLTERRDLARRASRRMVAHGERPLYRATLEPHGDFILIRIPELEIVTQARHRREVAVMARDLVATWLDVPSDAFDVEVEDVGAS